jgi:DNA-binding response OmpR family regulator
LERPRILVVEDSADSRELLEHLLSLEGFETFGACDGLEGLELAQRERPDLILTDLMMPRLTGAAMIEALRGERTSALIPIIAMTAAGSGDAKRAMTAGATAFVLKPLDLETVVALCRALLSGITGASSRS